jgi:hypothetical protein
VGLGDRAKMLFWLSFLVPTAQSGTHFTSTILQSFSCSDYLEARGVPISAIPA